MLRPFRDIRERMRIRTELPSQPCDAVNAWHLPVQMARGVVEAEADPAGKLVEKNVPATPASPLDKTGRRSARIIDFRARPFCNAGWAVLKGRVMPPRLFVRGIMHNRGR